MEHVKVRIRFKTPCLGARKIPGENRALFDKRDGDVVIFMPTWWREILDYGARAASPSVAVDLVSKVSFDPDVAGEIKTFERFYKRRGRPGTCKHEAFLPGSDFYFPSTNLGVRAAAVDFDGERVRAAWPGADDMTPEHTSKLFPNLVAGCDQLKGYLEELG